MPPALLSFLLAPLLPVAAVALQSPGTPGTPGTSGPPGPPGASGTSSSAGIGNRPAAVPSRVVVSKDVYTSVQVNVDFSGFNIPGDAANEPSIVVSPVDPDWVVIGWRQFDTVTSSFRQAGLGISEDGGLTWNVQTPLAAGISYTDPVLATNANGRLYYLGVTNEGGILHCNLFRTGSHGTPFQAPLYATGGDKPWLAIDRSGGVGNNNVYLFWDWQASCCGVNSFARSTNAGQSFTPQALLAPSPVYGTIDVGIDGKVYLTGVDSGDLSHFLFSSSSNAANPAQAPAFSPAALVDMGGDYRRNVPGPNPGGLYGQVWIVADRANASTLYLLSSVDPPGSDPMDVHFSRSTDGGSTWSVPVTLNDDAPGTDAWQWFGMLSIAPNGRLDAAWLDGRDGGGIPQLTSLYYTYSDDGGLTWQPNAAASPLFDSHQGWPIAQKIGDYAHMTSDDNATHIAYSATFNGEQDVFYMRIAH